MGIREWLVPTEKIFYALFESQTAIVRKGCEQAVEFFEHYDDLEMRWASVKKLEEEADHLVHRIHERLDASFILPMDNSDISALASSIDDVLDMTEAAVVRSMLYKLDSPPASLLNMARNNLEIAVCLERAVKGLRNRKNHRKVARILIEIHEFENHGDELYRSELARLFEIDDLRRIMKVKDLLDSLERAADAGEHSANIISTIIIKAG